MHSLGKVVPSRYCLVFPRARPFPHVDAVSHASADCIKDPFRTRQWKRRAAKFDPARFNTIGVKLARKAGVPIVPFALETSAWGVGKWFSDVGRIDPSRRARFAFGEPIEVQGRGTEEQEAIIRFIVEKLAMWSAGREICTGAADREASSVPI